MPMPEKEAVLDSADYSARIQALTFDCDSLWQAKAKSYPLPGAILPFNRILAYYGNLYSKRMGILGELPKDSMLRRLAIEKRAWEEADPATPVRTALHYIAMSAQSAPGRDGKYRLAMPSHQIDTIVSWAKEIDALVFLDIQIGTSNLTAELPKYAAYLKLPQVHFGIDPEFSMKSGNRPGTVIGTLDAADINIAIDFLADIVKANKLPPKVLIVHRFTQKMVTNYQNIKNIPEVQVVIDMDGWGAKELKRASYLRCIYREPVNLAGFKLFYGNDTKSNKNGLLTPCEVLDLKPKPIYIQYQ